MVDFIVWSIVLLILGWAIWYIVREKKKGVKCIGCPASATCMGKCCGNNCMEKKSDELL